MTLFVNACVRENSRTRLLADSVLSGWNEPIDEVCLKDVRFPVVDGLFLRRRDQLISSGQLDDPVFDPARQFASADHIVIAAPYWDLSFPAALKQYIEQINVAGITFTYTPQGIPQGLCRAGDLLYISSAGGNYVPEDYGYGYIKALAHNFYGIPNVRKILVKGLDVDGSDIEQILREGRSQILELLEEF